jgi:uncharacterized repeat protein (TIGR03803 family)
MRVLISLLLAVPELFAVPAWAASTETVLYSFAGGTTDGMYPTAALIFDKSGNLYGTTSEGGNSTICGIFGGSCGVVFQLTPASGGGWTETVLYEFTGGADGGTPYDSLVIDSDGNLYGTTNVGGASNMGTVFELSPGSNGSWTETVLHSFAGGSDGASPRAGLILKQNKLYGTTMLGGTGTQCGPFGGPCGTVFELTRSKAGWTEKVLHSFTGGSDGGYPYAGLTLDKVGNLYGTTFQNGTNGCGTVFELKHGKGTWTENTLYEFTGGNDGKASYGGVIFDPEGDLYGATSQGGSGGGGTVFELTPGKAGWTLTTLHAFAGSPDGSYSEAGLVLRGKNLYGTTYDGGTGSTCGPFGGSPCGTVVKLHHGEKGWTESVLYSFLGGTDGAMPEDSLIFDKAGTLYGTTFDGGTGDGVVFQIKH